jgi:hypothetical protein
VARAVPADGRESKTQPASFNHTESRTITADFDSGDSHDEKSANRKTAFLEIILFEISLRKRSSKSVLKLSLETAIGNGS